MEEAKFMGKQKKSLSVFALVMINCAAIMSLRNLPLLSSYGLAMITFYLIAALAFFIPVSLISAELASMIPEEGGMYAWVRAAIGEKSAFLCVWLSLITTVTALTMTLTFIATAAAFSIHPSLANSRFYVSCFIIAIIWLATLVSLKGMRISSIVTTISTIAGTLLPGLFIVFLGICWILGGHPISIKFTASALMPDFSHFSNVSFLAGIMFAFAGIEMSAFHVKDVENPRRSYPLAIFYSAALILVISILGSLAIAIVIPNGDIRIEAGVIQAFLIMLEKFHLRWLVPIVGFCIAFGGIAFVFAWISGPSRGLLATRSTGDLPPFLQRVNRHAMPSTILMAQALVVSCCALLFVFVKSISLGFWIINAASSAMILIMYFFLFLTAILLRKKMPNGERHYRVPFGDWGMWILGIVGMGNVLFCLAIAFILPSELRDAISSGKFACGVAIVTLVLSCPPLLFHLFKKPHWKAD
ncbi:MAG: APC family permease [Puniceicoccales bacterium]|jgi:amino acid transporter|nr:APC family permease [Puniceicoccales bacterium]